MAQGTQSWLATSVSQNLPHELDWTVQGQVRTRPGEFSLGEGIVDVGMGWSPDVLSKWSVDGTCRTRWEYPAEGVDDGLAMGDFREGKRRWETTTFDSG